MDSKRNITLPRMALTVIILFIGTIFLVQFDGSEITHAEAGSEVENEGFEGINSDNSVDNTLANCRYGLVAAQQYGWVVAETGAGIFYKFSDPRWFGPLPANDAEFIHMIRTKQEKTETGQYLPSWYTNVPLDQELAELISSNPGDLWIVGNEIERGPNPGDINPKNLATDDIYAEVYVEAYHDVYNFIKSNDPTARVANAGLIQITPMRLQYLDKMWDAYLQKYDEPMPVDVWTIHAYVLPELDKDGQPNNIASVALGTNPALGKRASGGDGSLCPDDDVYCIAEHDDISILEDQIVAMRQWMKARGQQDKPLVVTEYGTLYPYTLGGGTCSIQDEFGNCFTNDRVSDFMIETFDYFNNAKDPNLGYSLDDNKLVQQWIWFSAFSSNGNSGNLLRNNGTQYNGVGQTFKNHVQSEATFMNLFVETASGIQIGQDQGSSTAQLSVTFRNDGNTAVEVPFDVTFYSDAALTQPIATTTVIPTVRGCSTRSYTAEVEWAGLAEGTHQFWVLVDSNSDVIEQPAGITDNIGNGQVTVKNNTSFYTLDLQIENLGIGTGGTVSISPIQTTYEQGTEVTLEAIPFAGWVFSGWEGALTGNVKVAKVTMNSNVAVKAKFTQEQYDLEVKVNGNGQVSISPQKAKYLFGDQVTMTATPAEGWRFVTWSGDINDNTPSIQLSFKKDVSTTAHFAEVPPGFIFMPVSMKEANSFLVDNFLLDKTIAD